MTKIQDQEIKEYVEGLTDFQREIVMAIREIVLQTDSKMKESIKWGSIAFHHKKNICGFRVAKAHITLLFMEGASLNDTDGILEGTGAKARTYKVNAVEEINSEALSGLVIQSLEMGM